MFQLVAKTELKLAALRRLLDEDDPLPENLGNLHHYWTIGFERNEQLETVFLNTGRLLITFLNGEVVLATANTQGWHDAVRSIGTDKRLKIRQFLTAFVQSYPEIFKDMAVTMDGGGLLMIR